MRLIDLHCDTLDKLRRQQAEEKMDLMHNDYSISIPGMKKAGTLVQFFACFTYVSSVAGGYEECYGQVLDMIRIMKDQCRIYRDEMDLALSYEDIRTCEGQGKIAALLTVEEGGILQGRMERLEEIFRQGVRLITPMWNFENCFGFPSSRDSEIMGRGLKSFGREAVARAGEMGMIVDVSHASDGTFQDILDCARGPVVASHSNCRELCGHPRNLTDGMIRRLSEAGGVAGLNFYGMFLGGRKESRLEAMSAHIRHMICIGGSEFPAIGTDFDGFDGMEYEDIPRAEDMEKLWEALKRDGITERQLDGIWRGNAERVLKGLRDS